MTHDSIEHDAYILVRFQGAEKAIETVQRLYEKGEMSEKLMTAFIMEIENYF